MISESILSFKGFSFWEQYSDAVRSMLKKEITVIRTNPNHTNTEIEIHLKEHERAVASFEAMISPEKHNELIEKKKKRLSHKATQAALLIFLYRDEPILHSPFSNTLSTRCIVSSRNKLGYTPNYLRQKCYDI